MRVLESKFVASAPTSAALPPGALPEAAIVGRSNVGKSSLIAAMLGRKKLVRISGRPGCTQAINFFDVRTDAGPLSLVDLPGYGFAKAPIAERERWGPLISSYLEERPTLCLIVVLLDPRRKLRDDDELLFEMLSDIGRPVQLVATKIDKLPKSKRKPAIAKLAQQTTPNIIAFSSKSGAGVENLWRVVGKCCGIL